jgi:hypothetical protein
VASFVISVDRLVAERLICLVPHRPKKARTGEAQRKWFSQKGECLLSFGDVFIFEFLRFVVRKRSAMDGGGATSHSSAITLAITPAEGIARQRSFLFLAALNRFLPAAIENLDCTLYRSIELRVVRRLLIIVTTFLFLDNARRVLLAF